MAGQDGGGQLNFADLDLTQKRNHILKAALDALPEKSRQLLSTLALLSEAVDYVTLSALNPHLPPEPEEVKEPRDPMRGSLWEELSEAGRERAQRQYRTAIHLRKEYERAVKARLESPEFLSAPRELKSSVHDLERRGLLQYDAHAARWDLHPVVRAIAAGLLRPEEKDGFGQRMVDHFSAQAHNPYQEAETIEDVRNGLRVVRTLLRMGRFELAYEAFSGGLSTALLFNLEASAEVLSLLKPLFPQGWRILPKAADEKVGAHLAGFVAVALDEAGELKDAAAAYTAALSVAVRQADWKALCARLCNAASNLDAQNRLASEDRCRGLALNLAMVSGNEESVFKGRLFRFGQLAKIGNWEAAQSIWDLLDPMGRDWRRSKYRPGEAEHDYAWFRFWNGELTGEHLSSAERLAQAGKNRGIVRSLHALRGEWLLERGEWALAAGSLHEAVSMARAVGQTAAHAEAQLRLAQFHLGQLADPRGEAERLASAGWISDRALADLWLAIGDREQAKKYALAAYQRAWADGEPYVHRYELNKSRALLENLGVEIPELPPYDPAKDEKLPWEDEVAAAIEKLSAEKEARNPPAAGS